VKPTLGDVIAIACILLFLALGLGMDNIAKWLFP
jgi:hypothetical protein